MGNRILPKIILFFFIILLIIASGYLTYHFLYKNDDPVYSDTDKVNLKIAIENEDYESYKQYLNEGRRLSFAFDDGTTPLEKLIEANDLLSAEKIMKSGFDLSLVDNNPMDTITNIIVYNKNYEIDEINDIVETLIYQVSEEIEKPDSKGHSLLMNAIYANNTIIVKEVLKYIENIDKVYHGETALTLATSLGGTDLDIIKALINRGADINYQGDEGYTAIMYAISNYDTEILNYLLTINGYNINIQNDYGQTALHVAVDYYNGEAIDILLNTTNINQSILDNQNMTAKAYADHLDYDDLYNKL